VSDRRVIVGISGASGAIYGVRALEMLAAAGVETHLVVTRAARATLHEESGHTMADLRDRADVTYSDNDLGAALASGSFRTLGMLVAPCSVKSLSGIAHSYDDTLLVRAADVTLKERRRLVLLLRETPLHAGHLRLMSEADASGAVIMPPVPAFYDRPATLDDVVTHTVSRALDLFDVEVPQLRRWTGRRGDADGIATADDAG
jgi:flavin prenyltransferase